MSVVHFGIDPGWSGGIAVVLDTKVVDVSSMPDGELSVYMLLERVLTDRPVVKGRKVRVCLEKVGGYVPGSGGNIGSAMFEFGRCYGCLVTSLHCLGVSFLNPVPRVWQAAVGVAPRSKSETKEDHKRKLRDRAFELYPDSKPTLKTADAILLAHYSSIT